MLKPDGPKGPARARIDSLYTTPERTLSSLSLLPSWAFVPGSCQCPRLFDLFPFIQHLFCW